MTDIIRKQDVIWKTYPDYPFLQVNQFGEVRSKDKEVVGKDGRKYHFKGRVLKQHLSKNGYLQVSFGVNGKTINLYVHRMVATCYVPNSLGLPQVNHIDCDRTNNRWDNLEWCTPQYNSQYRNKLGHWVNNNPSHPVVAVNPETSEVFWFESQSEAARQLEVNLGNMNSVIKGKRYNTAGGYWFCNADETAVEKTRFKFGDKIAEKVEKLMR